MPPASPSSAMMITMMMMMKNSSVRLSGAQIRVIVESYLHGQAAPKAELF